jgi:hypothetical protein
MDWYSLVGWHRDQWVIHYIACWNEHDVVKRRGLVAQTWAGEGAYVDAHRKARGQEALRSVQTCRGIVDRVLLAPFISHNRG